MGLYHDSQGNKHDIIELILYEQSSEIENFMNFYRCVAKCINFTINQLEEPSHEKRSFTCCEPNL